MPSNQKTCSLCGNKNAKIRLHGFSLCEPCQSDLVLMKDETIQKHVSEFPKRKKTSYEQDVRYKLDCLEKEYVRKKIKLLHIKDRLNQLD